jgi:hypothetical protein
MALVKRGGGFLHKSSLKKFVGKEGYELDWNDKDLINKLDREVNKIVKIGARGVKALSKSMVPIDSGDLRNTIDSFPSKFSKTGVVGKQAYVEWVISAGDSKADYAAHVELGRYFKDSGTRIPAVPFIRRPLSIMRKKMRRLFINRLRRILD